MILGAPRDAVEESGEADSAVAGSAAEARRGGTVRRALRVEAVVETIER